MTPLNILQISSFLHHRGGDSTCLFTEAAGLQAAGHHIIPFAMRHPDNHPTPYDTLYPPWLNHQGPLAWQSALTAIWSTQAARSLDQLLERVSVDIAHIHHLHRHLTPAILAPLRRKGIPIVWTVHDYELICPNGLLYTEGAPCTRCMDGHYHHAITHRCKQDSPLRSTLVALEKTVHRALKVHQQVDRLLCPSQYIATQLKRAGIPTERIQHLPNPSALLPEAPSGGQGWLYAGRLTPEKGIADLIAAAHKLPNLPLTICGDGPERTRLEAQAPPWVSWQGHLSAQALQQRLNAAAVIAVPSRWPENQPYAVVEAQGAARPVVATAVGGIPELIQDHEDGLLIPPQNPDALAKAVRSVVDNPDFAQKLGKAGRKRVARVHAIDLHTTRLLAIYGSLLARTVSGSAL